MLKVSKIKRCIYNHVLGHTCLYYNSLITINLTVLVRKENRAYDLLGYVSHVYVSVSYTFLYVR